MNAPADILPTTEQLAAALPPGARSRRHDGWTAERQRGFLDAIAEGRTVEQACAAVALSVGSAYRFRRSFAGRGFWLAWDAAHLLARDALRDRMMQRALAGYQEQIIRPNGDIVLRLRHDPRSEARMLDRLDRQVEADGPQAFAAARAVAEEFDDFVDIVTGDLGPGYAAAFLASRLDRKDPSPRRGPLRALERAARREQAEAGEVDISDLDLADRASWTGEQWQRAEAAGLLALRPEVDAYVEDGGSKTAFEPLLPALSEAHQPDPEEPDDIDPEAAAREAEETERLLKRYYVFPTFKPRSETHRWICADDMLDVLADPEVPEHQRDRLEEAVYQRWRPRAEEKVLPATLAEFRAMMADELAARAARESEEAAQLAQEEHDEEDSPSDAADSPEPDTDEPDFTDEEYRADLLAYPALIVLEPRFAPDPAAPQEKRLTGQHIEDIVALDEDLAIRRRAEEETWGWLRRRSEVGLPRTLAELRALPRERWPLFRIRPQVQGDPLFKQLCIQRFDGELRISSGTAQMLHRPVRPDG